MATVTRRRLRQAAIVGVFVAGVFATAATSPPSTSIQIPPERASTRLDAGHPAALTRIVVRINQEATSASFYGGATLRIDSVRPVVAVGSAPIDAAAARFILASSTPDSLAPSHDPAQATLEPGPSSFQAEVRLGSEVALPMQCGIGPCERVFWLIAELADPEAGAVEIEWHVGGNLIYSSTTWPSGAGASIAIDPSVLVAGPVPSLVVSTEPEVVALGPRQPAAARLVEVRIGAEAIPQDGAPIAVMSVELQARPGSGGSYERQPLVHVYPLDELAGQPLTGPLPTRLEREVDPFAGCAPGAGCTRRFLVAIEWMGDEGEEEAYDWSVTLRRLDIAGAWSAPAELAATVERRFEVDPRAEASVLHFEGTSMAVDFDGAPQVQLELGTMTTATDPLARLLPAPAVMTYRTHVLGIDPPPSPDVARASANIALPGWEDGARSILRAFGSGATEVITNPLAACRVDDACPNLTISTFTYRARDEPLPTVPFEWSLDLTLFAFREAPLTLSSADHSPATP
jgi:hypothetical protein